MALNRTLAWLGVVALLAAGQPPAAGAEQTLAPAVESATELSVPARRSRSLQRGVIYSGLFAAPAGPGKARDAASRPALPEPVDPETVRSDVAAIAEAGFDHVRIEFDPAAVTAEAEYSRLDLPRLAPLEAALEAAGRAKLRAIVAPRLDGPSTFKLFRSRPHLRGYAAFLRELAGWLKDRDAQTVFLQVLADGHVSDQPLWDLMMEMLTMQARQGCPSRTLIVPCNTCVDGAWDSGLGVLAGRQVAEPNVIYDLHFVEPVLFTHQGGPGPAARCEELAGLPYPASLNLLRPLLLEIKDVPARAAAQEYGAEEWDAAKVRARIDRAADWAERWKAALRCGQFGLRRTGPPEASRETWLRDVRQALEARRMGWTVRGWEGDFRLTVGPAGRRKLDAGAARALGMARSPAAAPSDH